MGFQIEASHYEVAPSQHENAFYDPATPDQLSQEALYYIGDLLKHIREFTALQNL